MEDPSPADTKIHRLISALSDPSIDIRHQAIQALGKLGGSAVEPLVQALAEASDNDHRWYTALALSHVGAPGS